MSEKDRDGEEKKKIHPASSILRYLHISDRKLSCCSSKQYPAYLFIYLHFWLYLRPYDIHFFLEPILMPEIAAFVVIGLIPLSAPAS